MSRRAKHARFIGLSVRAARRLAANGQIRALDERLEATMREMGVTFDIARERPWGRRPWFCDLLPADLCAPEEWEPLERGVQQEVRAFEMFLRDIYGKKRFFGRTGFRFSRFWAARFTNARPPASRLRGLPTCTSADSAFAVFRAANSR